MLISPEGPQTGFFLSISLKSSGEAEVKTIMFSNRVDLSVHVEVDSHIVSFGLSNNS